jgi:hypothetical protein
LVLPPAGAEGTATREKKAPDAAPPEAAAATVAAGLNCMAGSWVADGASVGPRAVPARTVPAGTVPAGTRANAARALAAVACAASLSAAALADMYGSHCMAARWKVEELTYEGGASSKVKTKK